MQHQAGKAAPTLLHHHPLVLLLLLLPWSLTGPLTCNATDGVVVLGEGKQHIFPNKADEKLKDGMTLFVKRNSSFAGFAVNVNGSDGTEHTAWFPAEEEYFPDTDTWYQLLVFVKSTTKDSAIEFGFETEAGEWICEKYNVSQDLHSMNVKAHGAASWTNGVPPGGPDKPLATKSKRHNLFTCKPEPKPEPGHHISTSERNVSPAGMTHEITVLACVGVVVGALVVGAVLCRKKKGLSRPESYTDASLLKMIDERLVSTDTATSQAA